MSSPRTVASRARSVQVHHADCAAMSGTMRGRFSPAHAGWIDEDVVFGGGRHGHRFEVPGRDRQQTLPNLDMLSAHADADEIVQWCRGFARAPRMTFVTHGEPGPAEALSRRLELDLGWRCKVAQHLEEFSLS